MNVVKDMSVWLEYANEYANELHHANQIITLFIQSCMLIRSENEI